MPILRILCLKIGQRRHEDEMPKGEVISASSLIKIYGEYAGALSLTPSPLSPILFSFRSDFFYRLEIQAPGETMPEILSARKWDMYEPDNRYTSSR